MSGHDAMTTPRPDVLINEVCPRDGLQIEPRFVETAQKIALIDRLSQAGFAKIEITSFVSPKAVPNLRDADLVARSIRRNRDVIYVALVPNLRGAQAAIGAKIDEINLVMSVSETHNLANMRMTCEQSLAGFRDIADFAADQTVRLHGSLATSFGCPFEGGQPEARVLGFIETYLRLGLRSVSLADTTGMANPRQVARLVGAVLRAFPGLQLTLHFHDTRGMGLANVVAAFDAGAVSFDASLGGIGGCPFAPGASGNICTEDTVHMFEEMGVATHVDLPALMRLSRELPDLLGHETTGQVAKAGRVSDLHPVPASVLAMRAQHA